MGAMAFSLVWVMQALYHQPYPKKTPNPKPYLHPTSEIPVKLQALNPRNA